MLKLQRVKELVGKAIGFARTTIKKSAGFLWKLTKKTTSFTWRFVRKAGVAIWKFIRKIAVAVRKMVSNVTIYPSLSDVRWVAVMLALLPPAVLGTGLFWVFGWVGLAPLLFLVAIDARMVWRGWVRELEPTPPNKHLVMIFGSYQKTGEYSFLLLKGGLQFLPFYGRIVETKLVPISELFELEFEIPDVRTSGDNVISDVKASLRFHLDEEHLHNLLRIYGEVKGDELSEGTIKSKLQDLLDEVVKQAVREIAAHGKVAPNTWQTLKSAGQNLVDWVVVKILDGRRLDPEMTESQFHEEVMKFVEKKLTDQVSPGVTIGRYGIVIEGGAISDVKTDDPVVTSSEKMAVLQAEREAKLARANLDADRVRALTAAGVSPHDAIVRVNSDDGKDSIMIAGEGTLPILPLRTPEGGKK